MKETYLPQRSAGSGAILVRDRILVVLGTVTVTGEDDNTVNFRVRHSVSVEWERRVVNVKVKKSSGMQLFWRKGSGTHSSCYVL